MTPEQAAVVATLGAVGVTLAGIAAVAAWATDRLTSHAAQGRRIAALATSPLSSRTRERGGLAQTPASPSLGEDGGGAGTTSPATETGAGP